MTVKGFCATQRQAGEQASETEASSAFAAAEPDEGRMRRPARAGETERLRLLYELERARTAGNGFTPAVTVRSRSLGNRVEIRIRDNGNGIPAAVREKIFHPFFTTKPAGAGTGLGLSISREIIVQQHQGEIRVDSEEGSHTELIIVLPRGHAPKGPAT
jgi:signal transduction histidine kinase